MILLSTDHRLRDQVGALALLVGGQRAENDVARERRQVALKVAVAEDRLEVTDGSLEDADAVIEPIEDSPLDGRGHNEVEDLDVI